MKKSRKDLNTRKRKTARIFLRFLIVLIPIKVEESTTQVNLFATFLQLEFLAVTMEKQTFLKEEKLFSAFKLFDKDNDGEITADELKDVLGSDESYKDKPDEFW